MLPAGGLVVMLVNDVTLFAVSCILGLISILFLRSYAAPFTGETYKGISCVVIAVVLATLASSIGYESTEKKPIPCDVSCVKKFILTR